MAYSENEDLIRRLIQRYKEMLWFQYNLKEALDIIDGWHKAMYHNKKIPEFENLREIVSLANFGAIEDEIEK